MTISALANNNTSGNQPYAAQDATSAPSASNGSSASGTNTTSTSTASTQVSLSAEARAAAAFNALGGSMATFSIAGLDVQFPSAGPGDKKLGPDLYEIDNPEELQKIQKINDELRQAFLNTSPISTSGSQYTGQVVESAFENAVKEFGGTKAQGAQLFALLNTGDTGSISNSQLLGALAATLNDPSSPASKALMTAMDSDKNGQVSGNEFVQFETALQASEYGTPVVPVAPSEAATTTTWAATTSQSTTA